MKWMTNTCTFRLDDITPDMDWDKFYRVKAILDKYKVKPLLGVVPDNRDPGLAQEVAREDFWECIQSCEREGYAILDMAHPEPKRIQRKLFIKRVAPFGTMIPLQFSICRHCRRNHRLCKLCSVICTHRN